MPKANAIVEIEVKLFDRPRAFAFRGRSIRAPPAALRREGERANPVLGHIAGLIDTLAAEGWRYGTFKGHAVTLVHPQTMGRVQTEGFLTERFGADLLSRVTVRERLNGPSAKPPRL